MDNLVAPEGDFTPGGGQIRSRQRSVPAGAMQAMQASVSARVCVFVARSCVASTGRVMEAGAVLWKRCACAAIDWAVSISAWCGAACSAGVRGRC